MPHHHVVRLKLVILVAKVKVFKIDYYNLFKIYYYDFKNNVFIFKSPIVIILIIVTKP
jgi:hypothetical protein